MPRVYNPKQSRLLRGIEKVIDRQNAKPRLHIIDYGMNTFVTYKNKYAADTGKLSDYYFPLKWQPLRYVIKKIPHTTYTYGVGGATFTPQWRNKLKRFSNVRNKKIAK